MVKVECDGCRSTYEIEDRRIPAAGLKMRCTGCGKSVVVTKDGTARAAASPSPARPSGTTVPGGFSPGDDMGGLDLGGLDLSGFDLGDELPAVAPKTSQRAD